MSSDRNDALDPFGRVTPEVEHRLRSVKSMAKELRPASSIYSSRPTSSFYSAGNRVTVAQIPHVPEIPSQYQHTSKTASDAPFNAMMAHDSAQAGIDEELFWITTDGAAFENVATALRSPSSSYGRISGELSSHMSSIYESANSQLQSDAFVNNKAAQQSRDDTGIASADFGLSDAVSRTPATAQFWKHLATPNSPWSQLAETRLSEPSTTAPIHPAIPVDQLFRVPKARELWNHVKTSFEKLTKQSFDGMKKPASTRVPSVETGNEGIFGRWVNLWPKKNTGLKEFKLRPIKPRQGNSTDRYSKGKSKASIIGDLNRGTVYGDFVHHYPGEDDQTSTVRENPPPIPPRHPARAIRSMAGSDTAQIFRNQRATAVSLLSERPSTQNQNTPSPDLNKPLPPPPSNLCRNCTLRADSKSDLVRSATASSQDITDLHPGFNPYLNRPASPFAPRYDSLEAISQGPELDVTAADLHDANERFREIYDDEDDRSVIIDTFIRDGHTSILVSHHIDGNTIEVRKGRDELRTYTNLEG